MTKRSQPVGESLSVVTVCLQGLTLAAVKQLASTTGLIEIRAELQHYLADPEDLLPFEPPDVCLVDFDEDWEKAALTAARIHKFLGQTAIFAVSSNSQPDRIISAMQCCCREYLLKPLDQDVLMKALTTVWRRKWSKADRPAGQVLAFLGTKGGCGVTTLATQVAALLAKTYKRKTLLIDHHPQLGDASFYLAVETPQYHFSDLMESAHRLDPEFLQAFLVHHQSGLDVLPSPDKFDAPRQISDEALEQTIDFLRSEYDLVLVDCPPGLNERNMAMINHADLVYLVAVPEIAPLRNATRYLDYLLKCGCPAARIRLVVNRHLQEGSISDAAIERAIHKEIHWRVPNEYTEVTNRINSVRSHSASEDSEFMRNLSRWAEAIADKRAPTIESTQRPKQKQELESILKLRIVGGN